MGSCNVRGVMHFVACVMMSLLIYDFILYVAIVKRVVLTAVHALYTSLHYCSSYDYYL